MKATNRKRKTPTDPQTEKRMRIANGGEHLDTTILKERAKLNEAPSQTSARTSADLSLSVSLSLSLPLLKKKD